MVMRYAHLSAQHKKAAIDKLCNVFTGEQRLHNDFPEDSGIQLLSKRYVLKPCVTCYQT
jgi:hypothetical protein